MGVTAALKGIHGEFELIRTLGAAGVLTYIVTAPVFVAWSMYYGEKFELAVFCTAYPAGLAAVLGAVAGAVAVKDRNVATARVTNATADANTTTQPTI